MVHKGHHITFQYLVKIHKGYSFKFAFDIKLYNHISFKICFLTKVSTLSKAELTKLAETY